MFTERNNLDLWLCNCPWNLHSWAISKQTLIMQAFLTILWESYTTHNTRFTCISEKKNYNLTQSVSRNGRDIVKGEIYGRSCSTVVYISSTTSSVSSHTAQRTRPISIMKKKSGETQPKRRLTKFFMSNICFLCPILNKIGTRQQILVRPSNTKF